MVGRTTSIQTGFGPTGAKQNALTLAGWTVVRFTWTDLVERPEYVGRTILALLAREIGPPSTP